MAKNFLQEGDRVPVILGSGETATVDTILIQGSIVGVAQETGVAGDTIMVHRTGVWKLPKKTGTAWTQGDSLYWDSSPGELTKTAADGTFAGIAFADAASGATEGEILLLPLTPFAAAVTAGIAAAVGKLITTALTSGVLVVANTAITANSAVSVQRVVPGGTVSAGGYKITLDPGVGYTITALQAAGSATETGNTDTVCATIVY
jgi:predicted RecA/RadA family phage recombinase